MGQLLYIYDGVGGVQVQDTRTLQEAKDQRKKEAQTKCTALIISAGASEQRQRNVGLGIITGTDAQQIIDIVNHYRNQCLTMENNINAAGSNSAVDSVSLTFSPYVP